MSTSLLEVRELTKAYRLKSAPFSKPAYHLAVNGIRKDMNAKPVKRVDLPGGQYPVIRVPGETVDPPTPRQQSVVRGIFGKQSQSHIVGEGPQIFKYWPVKRGDQHLFDHLVRKNHRHHLALHRIRRGLRIKRFGFDLDVDQETTSNRLQYLGQRRGSFISERRIEPASGVQAGQFP